MSTNKTPQEILATGTHAEARVLALELLNENLRVRTILDTLARADIGRGALVEILAPSAEGENIRFVVCSAGDEAELARQVFRAAREFFGGAGVDVQTKLAGYEGSARGKAWDER